jgi:hypothetical protein
MTDLYPFVIEGARAMVFVDGENLAIRYGGHAGWAVASGRHERLVQARRCGVGSVAESSV